MDEFKEKKLDLRQINEKNQVTIPPEILNAIGAKKGDYLNVKVDPRTKKIILVPITVKERK